MLKAHGRPKIMVFINEKIDKYPVETSTVQTKVEDLLLKSGFLLVDKDQMKDIDQKDLAAAMAENKPEKAQAIAKRFGAQIFIKGSANADRGNDSRISGVDLATYEGEANLRVFRSDTGQVMAAVAGVSTRGVQRVPGSAAKQALDLQAKRVSPELQLKILTFWQDVLCGRGELKLEISGVSFKQYQDVKKALKEIKQIKEVTTEFHNNNVEASIQSDVGAEKLAEAISDAVKGLDIEDVSANVIKAKYKEK
jgi:copper chaperone CopZ